MTSTEEIKVKDKRVSCDGGKGSLGHPKVYLDVAKEGFAICPYCSKKFVLEQ